MYFERDKELELNNFFNRYTLKDGVPDLILELTPDNKACKLDGRSVEEIREAMIEIYAVLYYIDNVIHNVQTAGTVVNYITRCDFSGKVSFPGGKVCWEYDEGLLPLRVA